MAAGGSAKILRKLDVAGAEWQEIEGQTAKALPGQKIMLKLETAESSSVSDVEWTLDGKVFKDYISSNSKGELKSLSANDLQLQEIDFYWVDSGNKNISVNYKLNGDDKQTGLSFTVNAVESSLEIEDPFGVRRIGSVRINDVSSDMGLYANNISPIGGIQFFGKVEIPEEWGDGQWQFVQLVTPSREGTLFSGESRPFNLNGITCLDTTYPYEGPYTTGELETDTDSPETMLSPYKKVKVENESYVMYIEFKPPGTNSKFVPLRKLGWRWGGVATLSSDGSWVSLSATASIGSVPWRQVSGDEAIH